jgi:hypothetical protein
MPSSEQVHLLLPVGAFLALTQMSVNEKIPPAWHQQLQQHIGNLSSRKPLVHFMHDRLLGVRVC